MFLSDTIYDLICNASKFILRLGIRYIRHQHDSGLHVGVQYNVAAESKCTCYSGLKRAIPEITEKMLIQHLKQLQEDDLVLRTAEPVVPPFVTYSLTPAGAKLQPVLSAMAIWGIDDMEQRK